MGIRLRLGEADQGRYDRGDEWFAWDIDRLLDMPGSELVALEEAMDGFTVHQVRVGLSVNRATALRGAMFLARYLGGVREPWEKFDPAPLRIDYEADAIPDPTGSADPPPTSTTS